MSDSAPRVIRLVVGNELAGRTLAALVSETCRMTQDRARQLIELGSVRFNGKAVRDSARRIPADSRLWINLDLRLLGEHPHAKVLLEDDAIAVVLKAAGQPSQATRAGGGTSVQEQLAASFGPNAECRLVHRLDLPVSGLMVVAKSQQSAAALSSEFNDKTVEKCYCAVVRSGSSFLDEVAREVRLITLPLLWVSSRQRAVVAAEGSRCATAVATASVSLPAGPMEGRLDLLVLRLLTGRTHQIRAHLAAMRCPILGDRAYGSTTEARKNPERPQRIALHAFRLAFPHPGDGKLREFTSLPPADFWSDFGLKEPDGLLAALVEAAARLRGA